MVGITGYLGTALAFEDGDQALFALNYFQKALAFDMLPVAVPTVATEHADRYLNVVDGLIFTGGSDLDPELYGQPPHPLLGPVIRQRDEFELRLAQTAVALRLPVLGVCRGLQLLNVALGGSLEQHLDEAAGRLCHSTGSHEAAFHPIEVVDRELRELMGGRVEVNSLHHQAALHLGAGLRAAAWAPDGVLEAARGIDLPVLAVQWHPERMTGGDPGADAPFEWLRRQIDRATPARAQAALQSGRRREPDPLGARA